jgi:hypothetical protein
MVGGWWTRRMGHRLQQLITIDVYRVHDAMSRLMCAMSRLMWFRWCGKFANTGDQESLLSVEIVHFLLLVFFYKYAIHPIMRERKSTFASTFPLPFPQGN